MGLPHQLLLQPISEINIFLTMPPPLTFTMRAAIKPETGGNFAWNLRNWYNKPENLVSAVGPGLSSLAIKRGRFNCLMLARLSALMANYDR